MAEQKRNGEDRRERRGKQVTLNWITGAGFPILVVIVIGMGSTVWDMRSTIDKAKELESEIFELERELKSAIDRLEDELKKALEGHKGTIFRLAGENQKTIYVNKAEIVGLESKVDILLIRMEKVCDRLWELRGHDRDERQF